MAGKSPAITLLRLFGALVPGNRLKTALYLNCILRLRKAARLATSGFYRMDHVYDALDEFRRRTRGSLSILEFGTNEGYAFVKLLYATRYSKMGHRVTVQGFDSFEGMPAPSGRSDLNIVRNAEEWGQGEFAGSYERLLAYCKQRYSNFELHRGRFDETLDESCLASLRQSPPMLVWIDCDYYSSARSIFEKITPYIPSGCIIYFDEYEFNYASRFTGEARLVHEINQGVFGDGIELTLDTRLSWDSKRVYRFVRFEGGPHYDWAQSKRSPCKGRSIGNESPWP